jgi:hypothetical protein
LKYSIEMMVRAEELEDDLEDSGDGLDFAPIRDQDTERLETLHVRHTRLISLD